MGEPLGRLVQLVLRGDGLTTTALEILTGQPVQVVVRQHCRQPLPSAGAADAPGYTGVLGVDAGDEAAALELTAGDDVLVREVLLIGADGLRYGAARLVAAAGRLPTPLAHRLATTDEPIGRLLAAAGVPVVRQLRDWGLRRAGDRAPLLVGDLLPDARVPARTYLMRLRDGAPLALITEWFAPTVFAADHPTGGAR
ncbi:chorismate--pyruvate lyase family protein [Pilimelia columellifera]|uniref:Chorismate lyase n=1 Tax=Pilimelia columellifera subsp. columellifera TaxID=706583 RepID=A0ABP6AGU4_9ACTN